MTVVREARNLVLGGDPDRVLRVGDLEVSVPGMCVRMRTARYSLPLREFQLLVLLADNAERVVDRQTILDRLWPPGYEDTSGNLTVHVARLRKRIKQGLGVDYVRTVRGIGYVLEAPPRPPLSGADALPSRA